MDLGATKGEIALVAFVFVLIYASGLLPGLGERLGRVLGPRRPNGAGGKRA